MKGHQIGMVKKNKGLQKFTNIVDEESLDAHMKSNSEPQLVLDYLITQVNKIDLDTSPKEWQNKSCLLVYCAKKYGTRSQHEKFKNLLYNHNHVLIMATLNNCVVKNEYFPSVTTVANKTGLSRTTIYKHLRDEQKNGHNSESRQLLRLLVDQAIFKLYEIGVKDRNPSALKDFLKFTFPHQNNTVNNYIQINNLKITNEQLNMLPKETILNIERLISENL